MSDEEVFDLSGAAKYLGVSNVQMRTLATTGRVTYARIGPAPLAFHETGPGRLHRQEHFPGDGNL